jgi:hypothetical protein
VSGGEREGVQLSFAKPTSAGKAVRRVRRQKAFEHLEMDSMPGDRVPDVEQRSDPDRPGAEDRGGDANDRGTAGEILGAWEFPKEWIDTTGGTFTNPIASSGLDDESGVAFGDRGGTGTGIGERHHAICDAGETRKFQGAGSAVGVEGFADEGAEFHERLIQV